MSTLQDLWSMSALEDLLPQTSVENNIPIIIIATKIYKNKIPYRFEHVAEKIRFLCISSTVSPEVQIQ